MQFEIALDRAGASAAEMVSVDVKARISAKAKRTMSSPTLHTLRQQAAAASQASNVPFTVTFFVLCGAAQEPLGVILALLAFEANTCHCLPSAGYFLRAPKGALSAHTSPGHYHTAACKA